MSGPTIRRSTASPPLASACSVPSKPFTIHCVSTRRSTTSHPINSKPKPPRLLRRNQLPSWCPKVVGYRIPALHVCQELLLRLPAPYRPVHDVKLLNRGALLSALVENQHQSRDAPR